MRAEVVDIVDGRRRDAQMCFQGCAPEGLAITYRLKYLYPWWARSMGSHFYHPRVSGTVTEVMMNKGYGFVDIGEEEVVRFSRRVVLRAEELWCHFFDLTRPVA